MHIVKLMEKMNIIHTKKMKLLQQLYGAICFFNYYGLSNGISKILKTKMGMDSFGFL